MSSNRPNATEDRFAEQLAWLMDRAIKIGPFAIGLDGILGLIPGIGDVTSGSAAAVIIFRAIRSGVPKVTILRMLVNVGIDAILGVIPLIGDVFDFAFKANTRNYALYKEALSGTRDSGKDWVFIVVAFLIIVVLHALPIIALLFLATLAGVSIPFFF